MLDKRLSFVKAPAPILYILLGSGIVKYRFRASFILCLSSNKVFHQKEKST